MDTMLRFACPACSKSCQSPAGQTAPCRCGRAVRVPVRDKPAGTPSVRGWLGAAVGLLIGVAILDGQKAAAGNQFVIAACLAVCAVVGWALARRNPAE